MESTMNHNVKSKYHKREERYRQFVEKVNGKVRKLVLFKLILVFGGLGIFLPLCFLHYYYLGAGVLIAFLVTYIFLNSRHDKALYYQALGTAFIDSNRRGFQRLSGEWTTFTDSGEDLAQSDHFYAEDLDIVGQGSVFQCISSCATPLGRQKLKELLFTHPEGPKQIKRRQESVCELSDKLYFRQRLQGEGMALKESIHELESVIAWGGTVNDRMLEKRTRFILRALPLSTFLFLGLGFLRVVPLTVAALLIVFQVFLLRWKARDRVTILNTAYALKHRLEPYLSMLRLIEKKEFSSPLLIELKTSLYTNNTAPSKQLEKLSRICGNISNRNNMFYFLYNIFTLWDYQCEIALENWKQECGRYLLNWFEGIATFEALSSLSNLRHDNPGWAMPNIVDSEELYVRARQAGHPLIPKGRVDNDFDMGEGTKVLLVTGSNMSGKSTFLRTVGLNLVLAYAGAPTCAKAFSCSVMNVYTCMRISDNLEKNISGFYAELLRIKMIVDAVKTKGKVFFLLDEIFKGTNSYDRHHAAKVLITKLANNSSIGLVSTHDLELEVLERETNGQIANYHFQEHYDEGRIMFDYKLRPGVSKTRNAIYLIEALGIDLKES